MKSKTGIAIPIVIVLVGIGWLLNTLNIIADIDWVWTLGLAAIGIIVLIVDGLNRFSVVIGPFFLAASVLSVARQAGRLNTEVEAPVLVILFGILLLVAQFAPLPAPKWMLDTPAKK